MMLRLLILLFLSIFFYSCTSTVRTQYFPDKNAHSFPQIEKDEPEEEPKYIRFKDTVEVKLEPFHISKPKSIGEQFEDAVRLFDMENYPEACKKFQHFIETLSPGDSIYYESFFFDCECDIMENDFEIAKEKLEKLLEFDDLLAFVKQKTLVRLGHILCVDDKKEEAQKYFDKLKSEFPESKYNKLADCDKIK